MKSISMNDILLARSGTGFEVLNVGDIIRRGANYLICLDESEKVFRCWVEDAQVVS